jgi:hypothetical protein
MPEKCPSTSRPLLRSGTPARPPTEATATEKPENPEKPARKSKYIPWAELLHRTYGPTRPAPAPRGFTAPVAGPRTTVLGKPRPAPPLRRAARRGPSVGALRPSRPPRSPPVGGQGHLCLETGNQPRGAWALVGLGPCPALGDTSGASVTRLLPRSTRPEGSCTDYGPVYSQPRSFRFRARRRSSELMALMNAPSTTLVAFNA